MPLMEQDKIPPHTQGKWAYGSDKACLLRTQITPRLVSKSTYSRVQQRTPNTDWRGHSPLISLILKLGHRTLSANLGVLTMGGPRLQKHRMQNKVQLADGPGRPGCVRSRNSEVWKRLVSSKNRGP